MWFNGAGVEHVQGCQGTGDVGSSKVYTENPRGGILFPEEVTLEMDFKL